MEIEVGDYVRTESGIIEKIKTFDEQTNIFKDEKGKLQKWLGETVFGDPYCEEIVNHSKNIIDLIEVGDILKIKEDIYDEEYISEVVEDYDNELCIHNFEISELLPIKKSINENTIKIKTIVTKEQFESIEYKIGG